MLYRAKTYPKTQLNNIAVGAVNFDTLEEKSKNIISPPENITLKLKERSEEVSSEQLGVSVDYATVTKELRENRLQIPILNFLISKNTHAAYNINHETNTKTLEAIKHDLETPASPGHISLQEDQFVAIPAQPAIAIDIDQVTQTIVTELHSGQTTIKLPTKESPAPDTPFNKEEEAIKLNNSISTVISLSYNGENKVLTKTDLISLYDAKNETFAVTPAKVGTQLDKIAKQFDITISNRQQAIDQLSSALQNSKDTTITLQATPKKHINYTYCVSAKGVDESYLGVLKNKLQAVYNDARGWSVDGQIQFSPVANGCSFTVWLTAADLVPSFSSTICDNIWSCRVGNNVILNFDRWTGASPAWNSAGGTLDDYRSMVINHETGHWLGFGHRFCGGASQPAPVMQQQSMGLQGCSFNPWPTATEIQALKKSKGL